MRAQMKINMETVTLELPVTTKSQDDSVIDALPFISLDDENNENDKKKKKRSKEKGGGSVQCRLMEMKQNVKMQCKQRAVLGFTFCIRHILNDSDAPFKRCEHRRKPKKKVESGDEKVQCQNAIRADGKAQYCSTHQIMFGLKEAKKKDKKIAPAELKDMSRSEDWRESPVPTMGAVSTEQTCLDSVPPPKPVRGDRGRAGMSIVEWREERKLEEVKMQPTILANLLQHRRERMKAARSHYSLLSALRMPILSTQAASSLFRDHPQLASRLRLATQDVILNHFVPPPNPRDIPRNAKNMDSIEVGKGEDGDIGAMTIQQRLFSRKIEGQFRKNPVLNQLCRTLEETDFDRFRMFPLGFLDSDDDIEDDISLTRSFTSSGGDLDTQLYLVKKQLRNERSALLYAARANGPIMNSCRVCPNTVGLILRQREGIVPIRDLTSSPSPYRICTTEGCNHTCIPLTNHCPSHILDSVSQRLFTYCSFVSCSRPVLSVNGPHTRGRCHEHREIQEERKEQSPIDEEDEEYDSSCEYRTHGVGKGAFEKGDPPTGHSWNNHTGNSVNSNSQQDNNQAEIPDNEIDCDVNSSYNGQLTVPSVLSEEPPNKRQRMDSPDESCTSE